MLNSQTGPTKDPNSQNPQEHLGWRVLQQKLYNSSQLLTIAAKLSILDVLGAMATSLILKTLIVIVIVLCSFYVKIYIVQYKKEDVIFITIVLSDCFTTLAFISIIPPMLTMMLFVRSTWVIGIVLFKIVNFSRRPIARSTRIPTSAICLDMPISLAVICFFPLVNAGVRSTALLVASSSSTKKPQSANTQSTWVSLSRKPEFKVISLSEALPPQPAKRKLTAPAGFIPIRYLIVLWDL